MSEELSDRVNSIGDAGGDLPGRIEESRARRIAPFKVPPVAQWLINALTPLLFPSLIFLLKPVTVNIESRLFLGANPKRRYLLVQNNSLSTVYMNFDQESSENNSLKIPAGGSYEPARVPLNSIFMSGSVDDLKCIIIEA